MNETGACKIKTLWEQVRELEKEIELRNDIYGGLIATLHVNFGDDGRRVRGLVNNRMTGIEMLMAVIEWYEKN